MLYLIYRGNHPDLNYRGGQQEVIHLVSSVETVIKKKNRLWAYSDGNASASYTSFYNDINMIKDVLSWRAIKAHDWQDPAIKEKKQSEFLVQKRLNWEEIHAIGIYSNRNETRLKNILKSATHEPKILIKPDWYY